MELVSVKVLVIGGVAAGTKAAAKLKREDRGLDVALITKDQDISYAGCGLPYYVGGMIESRDELIVNTPEKYAALRWFVPYWQHFLHYSLSGGSNNKKMSHVPLNFGTLIKQTPHLLHSKLEWKSKSAFTSQ